MSPEEQSEKARELLGEFMDSDTVENVLLDLYSSLHQDQ